jgi:hypothetical protein
MADFNFESLNINPDRVCEGISKIGYSSWSALMDIVDNSITAGATKILVELVLKEGTTLTRRNNIAAFRVIDNGCGMNDLSIKVALDIGSMVNYSQNSLSKFGLGLKSAGFSLGRKIQVLSKIGETVSDSFCVDRDVIRERNQYGVCRSQAVEHHVALLEKFESGTVVEISNPVEPQDSAAKIVKYLKERLGIVYYHFLTSKERPVEIVLKCKEEERNVVPIDILFRNISNSSFDEDSYDGRLPCSVLDDLIEHPYDGNSDPIKLQVTIFPQSAMSSYPGFSEQEKNQITQFLVGRENSGFFIFRNGRLIRWGNRIAGVTRNDIGFRAKVMITSDHDELFHVDVSKQNLMIPEDMEDILRRRVRIPLTQGRQLFAKCRNMLTLGTGDEGEESNKRLETFEEEDMDEITSPPSPQEKALRRKLINERTQKQEQEEKLEGSATPALLGEILQDLAEDSSQISDELLFKRVRYTDVMQGLSLWAAGHDPTYGTFVRINRNHPFYDLVLSNLSANEPSRQSMEALLFACAIAENKTIENLASISEEDIDAVLKRFKRVFSQNLDSWANSNQDLYE